MEISKRILAQTAAGLPKAMSSPGPPPKSPDAVEMFARLLSV